MTSLNSDDEEDDFRPSRKRSSRSRMSLLDDVAEEDADESTLELPSKKSRLSRKKSLASQKRVSTRSSSATSTAKNKSRILELTEDLFTDDDDDDFRASGEIDEDDEDSIPHPDAIDSSSTASRSARKSKSKSSRKPAELAADFSRSSPAPPRIGFCPFCQVPFSALSRVESDTWHVSSCLSSPSKAVKECVAGKSCDSTIASHYKKFTHRLLARWRDGAGDEGNQSPVSSQLPNSDAIDADLGAVSGVGVGADADVGADSDPGADFSLPTSGVATSSSSNRKRADLGSSTSSPSQRQLSSFLSNRDSTILQKESISAEPRARKSLRMGGDIRVTSSSFEPSEAKDAFVTKRLEDEIEECSFSIGASLEATIEEGRESKGEASPSKNNVEVDGAKRGVVVDRKHFGRLVSNEKAHAGQPPAEEEEEWWGNVEEEEELFGTQEPIHRFVTETKSDVRHDLMRRSQDEEEERNPKAAEDEDCENVRKGEEELTAEEGKLEGNRNGKERTFGGKVDSIDCSCNPVASTGSSESGSQKSSLDPCTNVAAPSRSAVNPFAVLMLNAKNQIPGKSSKDKNDKTLSAKSKSKPIDGKTSMNVTHDRPTTASHVISQAASEWLKNSNPVFPKNSSSAKDNAGTAGSSTTAPGAHRGKELGMGGRGVGNKKTRGGVDAGKIETRNDENHGDNEIENQGAHDATSTSSKPKKAPKAPPRPCPFYKWIPNTSFTVDAFSFGQIENCRFYFLSHFHADHYKGLRKNFSGGTIVCSNVTANLVKSRLGVSASNILSAAVDETLQIEGARVTLIEANHCPGAVLFLFRFKNGAAYLHTGDFRADEQMIKHPTLQQFVADDCRKRLDGLFLDTTYLDPRYSFPPQRDVIEFSVKLALDHIRDRPKTLIICGSYTIGKERIFKAIAKALRYRVFVRDDKLRVLNCLEDPDLTKMLTKSDFDARLHVLPMHLLNKRSLKEYLSPLRSRFDNVLALKPTGWTFEDQDRGPSGTLQPRCSSSMAILSRIKPQCESDGITIYGVPYSEHSSFEELKRFVKAVKPVKIIPTVNVGNAEKRDAMQRYFKEWLGELG